MKVKFKTLQYPHQDMTQLLDHIESEWIKLGGQEGLKKYYIEKLSTLLKDNLNAESIYDNDTLVGCYWVELISPHYGNVTIYCSKEKYTTPIVDRLVQNGIFINAQIEIVTISFKETFRQLFMKHDLIINERQRMALQLDTLAPFTVPDQGYHYFLMSKDYHDITGSISYEAHRISKDYEHYPEMNTCEKRTQLEKNVFDGRSGPVNKNASLMICKDTTIIGYCLIVDIKNCWGHDLVPWIFDISIHPSYMGKHLGKTILQLSINALIEQKLPILGLAVTETNFNAIALYESLGFYVVDDFYEFIKPVKL